MTAPSLLRADLHVHTYHSGYASHLRFLQTRDCYSEPEAVYRVAKTRGMDLVTFTDHDRIDGCLEYLDRHPDAPDFFISEEAECWLPDTTLKLHVAMYDIDEHVHAEVRRRHRNVYDVVSFLREREVCFALNHLFFFFRQQISVEAYLRAMLPLFPAFEIRNGAMRRDHNELIDCLLRERASGGGALPGLVGGSDAHTLRRVGTTYTEAPGRTREEFLRSLRSGHSRACGRHGTAVDIAAEIYGVIGRYWATLAGFGRPGLSWPRRGLGWIWSVASLPVEFIPLVVAVTQKSTEARTVSRCRREIAAMAGAAPPDRRRIETEPGGSARLDRLPAGEVEQP